MSQRSRARDVILRSLAAAVVGSVIAGTSYLCAYSSLRNHPNYGYLEEHTRHELDALQKAVEKHRQTTGRLPANLADLEEAKGERRFRVDDAGRVVDIWGHPYLYSAEGESFTLYSYGPDGRPGGEGRDADIYPASLGRPPESPTLRQFTFDLPTAGVQLTCVLAGVCAGLICLLPPSRKRPRVEFLARVGATAIGTVLTAVVISYLHVPTGH